MSSLVEFCCYNYLCCKNGAILLYDYFLMAKRSSPPVQTVDDYLSPLVAVVHRRFETTTNGDEYLMSTHHQRFSHSSPTVCEPAVMTPSPPAVMAPPNTIDLNPMPPNKR
jgi:hypothetical protein